MTIDVNQKIRELFEWIFGDRDNAVEAMTDLDGTLARAGITEADLTGVDIPSLALEACTSVGLPAPAGLLATTSVGGAVATAPAARPASSSAPAPAPSPSAPTPPPPPPQPTYEYAKQYVTYVTEVVYEGDEVIQQTIVDNSVDNSTTIVNDNSTNINVEDVEGDVDLNLDVENTNVSNTGDGGVATGGNAENVNTGERGVIVDMSDDDLLDADLGGGFGRGVPNGFTNGGSLGGGRGPGLQINTGDNVNQTGGDVSDSTQVTGGNSGTVTGDIDGDNVAFGSNNVQGNEIDDSAVTTEGDATNESTDIKADRGASVAEGGGDATSSLVIADNSAVAVGDSDVDAEDSLNELNVDLGGRNVGFPGSTTVRNPDFGGAIDKAIRTAESDDDGFDDPAD